MSVVPNVTAIATFVHIGYGRYLSWCNGIHITNRLVSGILIVLASQTALFIWTAMPLQCIYRYAIVKTGNRPRSAKLFIYITLTLTSFLLQFYMSFATIDVSDANFLLRHDSAEILQHVGYSLNESEIHGIFRHSCSLRSRGRKNTIMRERRDNQLADFHSTTVNGIDFGCVDHLLGATLPEDFAQHVRFEENQQPPHWKRASKLPADTNNQLMN
ncbi:hypothetical protein M3Y96_00413100 [Aphelenchoides besseyi]|nr:hypothetical protein M3Y96_00413100 [Aphelenchoides besseyi]